MTITTAWCAVLLSTTVAQGGPASGPTKIAVVSLTAIFDRYQMTRDLEQMFDERRQSVTAEAERRREDIKLQRAALMDMKPGTADYAQREEAMVKTEVEFQAWLEIQERRLKAQHKAWLAMIYDHARTVIAKIAQERGIDMVLSYDDVLEDTSDSVAFKQQILLRNVIYANDRVNLTETAIEMLDRDYQMRGGASSLQPTAPVVPDNAPTGP